jgi:hypothetical protein
LRNVLVRVPNTVATSLRSNRPGEEAQPFTSLLRMESPTFELASADTEMKFDQQPF